MTLLGRVNHAMSTRLDPLARAFARFHARRHAAGKGRLLDRYFGAPVFALSVVGRRSGEARAVMLILTRRGDDVVVAASNAGNDRPPSWFLNLRAAGRAVVDVGGRRWTVTPRLAEGAERDECWSLLVQTYPDFATYQGLTERRIPVVILEPSAASGHG